MHHSLERLLLGLKCNFNIDIKHTVMWLCVLICLEISYLRQIQNYEYNILLLPKPAMSIHVYKDIFK